MLRSFHRARILVDALTEHFIAAATGLSSEERAYRGSDEGQVFAFSLFCCALLAVPCGA